MPPQNLLDQVPRDTISAIDDDLDVLEDLLEPLMAFPLEETLEKLTIIERAKLQTTIPYVVNDLIIMYLKMNGVNPHDHPVMAEMKRVKTYFDKIAEAEHPPQKSFSIDKAAASRFIKGAIATASGPPKLATGDSAVIGSHLRFDISGTAISSEAAAKIAARNKEPSSDEESDEGEILQVNGGDLDPEPLPRDMEIDKTPVQALPAKRKRPAVDPFAGYDGTGSTGPSTPASQQEDTDTSLGTKPTRKKKRGRPKKKQAQPSSGA